METDQKKCPQCAETVKAEAKICRFCNYGFENATESSVVVSSEPAKRVGGFGKGCLIVLGIFVVLGVIGSLANHADTAGPTAGKLTSGSPSPISVDGSNSEAVVGLIGPKANAARSAQQYLTMTGFSRKGLIEQLSSDAGSGYDVADATTAVDSLSVDWNEQAARSAKQYINMTGFSCSGLIEQLSSDAGSGYTASQARYGAEQAGAC